MRIGLLTDTSVKYHKILIVFLHTTVSQKFSIQFITCSKSFRHKWHHFLGITHIVLVEKDVNLQDGQLCKRGHVSSVVKFIQSQSGMRLRAFPSNTNWNFTIVSSMTPKNQKDFYGSNFKGNWDLLVIDLLRKNLALINPCLWSVVLFVICYSFL